MFNEQFAAQTSEEIRKTFKMKRERGEFIGAFAPYGYIKDPSDKNRLLIDEDAAQVVRSIFNWFVNEGYSKLGIAKEMQIMADGIGSDDPYLVAFLKHQNIKALNRGILVELIDAIWIHEGGEVMVDLNYADQFHALLITLRITPTT